MNCLHVRHRLFSGMLIVMLAIYFVPADELRAVDDVNKRYFSQLRQRRLFSLAEGVCIERLSGGELSRSQRTLLTIELSRTLTEHARYTSGKEQAELWRRSSTAIDEVLSKYPKNPQSLLLETQRALTHAAQGEHLRWQTQLFPNDQRVKPRAVAAFNKAITQLKALEKRTNTQLRQQTPRATTKQEALTPYQLRALAYHLAFQIGQTLVERAKLEPAGSPDRVATLIEAESWLGRLSKRPTEQELTLESRLAIADSNRMRGERRKANDVIRSIRAAEPPRELLDRTTAVEAQLLLDSGRAADAAQLLSRYRIKHLHLPGQLLFLQIEALSSLWAIAQKNQNDSLANQLLEQIEAHAARADSQVGGFWAYRCRLLVETMLETKRYGVELAAIVREARTQYSTGEIDKAVQTYGRAYSNAESRGESEIAMEIGYTRASVLLQSKDYLKSAESFQQLALRFPESPRAATAHLLSAYSLGRAYEQRRTKIRREQYTDALVRQRKLFPGHESALEATWMLALLEEQRLQVTRALKLYREIPESHPRGPVAHVAVARCYEKIIDRVRELGRPPAAWEDDATKQLQAITKNYGKSDQSLSLPQTEVCLRYARICLNRAEPDYRTAGELLVQIELSRVRREKLADSPPESKETTTRWKLLNQAATQLRIVTLAGGGRFDEAKQLVATLAMTNSRDVLGILDGLSDLTAEANELTRRQLGGLQLSAARDLDRRRSELKPPEQRRLDHCLAQAYVATDQSTQAIQIYRRLLSQAPKDRRLLKTVAELLTDCATPGCLREAKESWRKLESLERAGDVAWMAARYRVAWCAMALKQYEECRKLLTITRLVYPALGGTELRRQFEQLEKQLEKIRT